MAKKKKAGELVVRFKYGDDSFGDVPFEQAAKARDRQMRALGAIEAEEKAKAARSAKASENGKKGAGKRRKRKPLKALGPRQLSRRKTPKVKGR